jgi:hypothetical protein
MKTFKILLFVLLSVLAGIAIGGYLFSKTQPRSVLSLTRCRNCLTRPELLGLIASVGIQRFPGLTPSLVYEADKTVVIRDTSAPAQIHYVLFPKKDIKNIGEISESDAPYLMDLFLVSRWLIEKGQLFHYRLFTNGPGLQDVTYLHFRLAAE